MSESARARYLSDHMAGAVAALELLEHLEKAHADSGLAHFLRVLRGDIETDRHELAELMRRLHIGESAPRKAAAWLAEQVVRLKLKVDDSADGALRLLESVEAVALGIEGKLALWHALATAATDAPELLGPDYARLAERAAEQRRRVEPVRLDAARAALRARTP